MDIFQSPPSVRKATPEIWRQRRGSTISIPAFREEGDIQGRRVKSAIAISIPAFREEGDKARSNTNYFLWISIPAFREEGDGNMDEVSYAKLYFNPRLP